MQVLFSCWINFRASCLGGTDGNIQKRQDSPEETIRWKTPSTRCEMSHMLFHPIRFESAARLLLPYTILANELTSYYLCLGQSHPFVIYHWWLIVIISHIPNDGHVLDRSPPGQESCLPSPLLTGHPMLVLGCVKLKLEITQYWREEGKRENEVASVLDLHVQLGPCSLLRTLTVAPLMHRAYKNLWFLFPGMSQDTGVFPLQFCLIAYGPQSLYIHNCIYK